VKIRRGTKFDGTVPCRWIEPRTIWQWELEDLINGLCSKHARSWTEDTPLPAELTETELIDTVKEEFEYHGTSWVWTWVNDVGHTDAIEEARRLILAVFPDLTVPKEQP
jgi:hypothetical protein